MAKTDDHANSDLPAADRAALALTDAYVTGARSTPEDPDALSAAERIGLLAQVMKYRIGSTTRIALGMDPEEMALLEK